MAKFSRGSTAYKQDGSVVAAGVPRFESNGVMVEEGTTNLVSGAKQDFVTGWIKYGGEGITVTDYDIYVPSLGKTVTAKRITGNGLGTSYIKYYCDTSAYAIGDIITTSLYIKLLS